MTDEKQSERQQFGQQDERKPKQQSGRPSQQDEQKQPGQQRRDAQKSEQKNQNLDSQKGRPGSPDRGSHDRKETSRIRLKAQSLVSCGLRKTTRTGPSGRVLDYSGRVIL